MERKNRFMWHKTNNQKWETKGTEMWIAIPGPKLTMKSELFLPLSLEYQASKSIISCLTSCISLNLWTSHTWWYKHVIPGFGRWRQEDLEFKVSLHNEYEVNLDNKKYCLKIYSETLNRDRLMVSYNRKNYSILSMVSKICFKIILWNETRMATSWYRAGCLWYYSFPL